MAGNKASIKANFFYNMIYEVLVLAVPLVTTPYVARTLGAENVGIYNYITANVTYFTLIAAFGSASYAKREIAFCGNDVEKLSNEFWGIFFFRLTTTIFSVGMFVIFMLLNKSFREYYLVSSISVISVAVDISWFFQGKENFKITVVRNVIIKTVATVMIFSFVRTQKDLMLYVFINVGSVLLGNASLWSFLKRYIYGFKVKYIKGYASHFVGALKLFVPVLAIQVYTVVDKTMLGALINATEVGYYSQSEKIVKIIITVVNSLAVVLLPRISALISQNKYVEANQYYSKSVRFAALLTVPCTVGCFFVADDFIVLFLGEGFTKSIPVLKILSVLFVVLGMARVIGTPLLIPLKRENKYTVAVCSGAVINVVLNSIMIPRYQAVGASIATICAESMVTFLEIFFIRDLFESKVIFKSIIHYCIPSMLMAGVITLVRYLISDTVLRLVVSVIAGGSIYVIVLLVIKDELIKDNLLNPIFKKLHIPLSL